MGEDVSVKRILQIINQYCDEHSITISKYAKMAGVSKSWLSRLENESNKNISINVAEKLLEIAGYKLQLTKAGAVIVKNSRLKKINGQIFRGNIHC